MSRNPNKTYCTMPGCRNWAMRGHERCRWHTTEASTTQDGARGPGAPLHNLNALKHGASANPLPSAALRELIAAILSDADDLPYQLGLRSAAEIPSCEGRRSLDPRSHRRRLFETKWRSPKRSGGDHPPRPSKRSGDTESSEVQTGALKTSSSTSEK